MKKFTQDASAARFLLGGIGTGNISLDQNARLCDFELWNRPNKKFRSPYTFFAVRAEKPDGAVYAKALESQLAPPFDYSHGANAWDLGGLSRFENSEMSGVYPFVTFTLKDESMPLEARLEAFTPFIPLATDDSSLPVAVLRYTIKNTTDTPLTVSVAGSMANLTCLHGTDLWNKALFEGESVNQLVEKDEYRGIHFLSPDKTAADPNCFEMAFLTTEKERVSYLDNWNEGSWWDGLQDFWNDFIGDGELTSGRKLRGQGNNLHQSHIPIASICVKKELAAGEEACFEFIISWYHPNRVQSWNQNCCASCEHPTIRNYYAKFGPPLESAAYLVSNLQRLETESRKFIAAMTGGTLPEPIVEAVLANITVIRSTTCFRVEDGTFFGWEGCFDNSGCCDGNCTHVWNYTQTMAFLFPELERSMRRTAFLDETDDSGRMFFRAYSYLHDPGHTLLPAADGQLGSIIQLYRDWKLCGDDAFIKELWPKAKLALAFGVQSFDRDGDGLLDGQLHNTYDIEFYGVSSMLNSIFFAALRAGEEISAYLGDTGSAAKFASIREKGAKKLDELTFNGEYYEQTIDNVNAYKYQYGIGCLSDQLLGQQLAHVSKLGYVLDQAHVKSAVHSIFKHNFREDLSGFTNVQRTYALNHEGGLLLCSWPNGGRPEIPFVYCDEVWTGIEYQIASHLIYEGFVDEGLRIVTACRERHDGIKRSPWNEVECGHHYARSLASYGVLLAYTGFHCDAVSKTLTFRPAVDQDHFIGFFCCADGWGLYHQTKESDGSRKSRIETLYGNLDAYQIVIA